MVDRSADTMQSAGPAAPSQAGPAALCGEGRYRRYDEGCGLGAVGSGSYGRVYIGHDLVLGTVCALKRQEKRTPATSRELAFYKSMSQFPHPNVMALLDHFTTPSYLYMVFELMDIDLWSMWQKSRKLLPPHKALRFLRHLVEGVAHLHMLSIVHTDLSMANMLIGQPASSQGAFELRGPVLRITDLGGAASAHAMVLCPKDEITTEYCRAPEIFLGARTFSSAVDVWAVGIAGMALLCGSTIFWRQEHYEEDRPGFVPRGASKDGAISILKNQVAALGSIDGDAWSFYQGLPRWSKFAEILAQPGQYRDLAQALADPHLVRRPLDSCGPAAALLSGFLRWLPDGRCTARASLASDIFASEALRPSRLAAALVKSATLESLQVLVLRSWWRGLPIELEDLPPLPAWSQSPPALESAASPLSCAQGSAAADSVLTCAALLISKAGRA